MWDEGPRAPLQRDNPAQQLMAGNRSVILSHSIAAGHEFDSGHRSRDSGFGVGDSDLGLRISDFHHAVGDKPAVAFKNDNITWERLCGGVAADGQDVTGPHGGQHA
jgi:hypothetical protein